MLHARVIRPPAVGAVPVAVDESSIAAIPGARVVRRAGVLAVLAPKEWDAIRAMRALTVTWSQPGPAFPEQAALFDHLRGATPVAHKVERADGDAATALAGAARVVTAEYEWPFQAHASLGPACVVADVRSDQATIWTGTQKPHFAREGVAKLTGLPLGAVRSIWVSGPGCYGRNDAGDAAMDAAFLSQTVGAPVRVQYMRQDGTAWDPKGPASVHRGQGGFDTEGKLVAVAFDTIGFSRTEVDSNESDPRDTLAGQLLGMGTHFQPAFGAPGEAYVVPNRRLAWSVVAPLHDVASPLRGAHLRDPVGPQLNFASESFMDELAAAAGADPVEFRLAHLTTPRGIAVIRAAAERYGWTPRRAASAVGTGNVVTGRGIAYAQRSATLVAVIAEVEVERASGQVRARRFVVAHDCGLVINPEGTRRTIEGNIVHGLSRAMWEEVVFDPHGVTSVDWASYPILEIADAPVAIDIVLLDRPHEIAAGAGEASTRPVAAAMANAIFDATGVRLRRAPFTPKRVRAALA
jgi:CO/xanthine dehydrogenase Mo-binding subunit